MVTSSPGVPRRFHATTAFAALSGLMLLLVITAYYPFNWDPPRFVHNDVSRSGSGALRFGEMNRARTTGTPQWLASARTSSASISSSA